MVVRLLLAESILRTVRRGLPHCMDVLTIAPHHAPVRVLTHIKRLDDCFGQFLVRVLCNCGACREIEPEALAPSRRVNDAPRARATDALLEVRKEGRGGDRSFSTGQPWYALR